LSSNIVATHRSSPSIGMRWRSHVRVVALEVVLLWALSASQDTPGANGTAAGGGGSIVANAASDIAASEDGHAQWPAVTANADCTSQGLYFDPTVQRCLSCKDVNVNAELISPAAGAEQLGAAGQCACKRGFVQCAGGDTCTAGADAFKAEGIFECRACPSVEGRQTAPSQDRSRCIACFEQDGNADSTLGFSDQWNDCLCPVGHALVERKETGEYLSAKICVRCAAGMAPGPSGQPSAVYHCRRPCPDVDGLNFIEQGGACIAVADYQLVNDRFPVSSAKMVTFRDLIDNRESWFRDGPFGGNLGIDAAGDNTLDVLRLDDATRVDTPTVSSSTVEWLYMRCGVGCLHGNATACECISNLCVLMLYEDSAVVCRFLTNFLYEGKPVVNLASRGKGQGLKGMPWLFYQGQFPTQIVTDPSLQWKFTLSNKPGGRSDVTNTLKFWLAKYSLGGSWLGWESLGDQLDLCANLGGTSMEPLSPSFAWRRFASSLTTKCSVPLENVLKCGRNPIFYDLFIEDTDGTLLPVPVRILNLIKDQRRPNLNFDGSVWQHQRSDVADDVLVRRFTLCDSVSGRGGGKSAFLDSDHLPVVFRFAAHMAMEVSVRTDTDGQIYVPVLSIAYAEKKVAQLSASDLAQVSFKAEYSMATKTYWTVMVVFIILVCLFIIFWSSIRMYLASCRYPNIPLIVPGGDLNMFMPKFAILLLSFFSTGLSVLFWFHWTMAMYWLVVFKAQDAPFLLLPSALQGNQYEPHDVLMTFLLSLSIVCVVLDFVRLMGSVRFPLQWVFIFLVDWERGEPLKLSGPQSAGGGGGGQRSGLSPRQQLMLQQQQQQQQFGGQFPQNAGQLGMPVASLMGQGMLPFGYEGQMGQQQGGAIDGVGMFPDMGVSAWRTIFVANQLNERLSTTRTLPYVTWLGMVALLEGLHWKNAARWYPRFAGNEDMLSAQFNPFIQFALGTSIWLAILLAQLIVRRVASIFFGNEHHDFVDVCSVANVSVFFLDEPFHGYYIHGKAPGGRGDLCHSEIANQLHKEDKGIGLPRGLTLDECQTFEIYLPPDLSVQISGSSPAHLRQTLCQIFGGVNATLLTMANRRPGKPEPQDIAEMSVHRCRVQALIDAMVHAVMRRSNDVVQHPSAMHWFWGRLPQGGGGVAALRHPIFWKDMRGLSWASCLAYGADFNGFPTGFEWHLALLELLCFQMCWRFQGSIYLATAVAFLVNQGFLGLYGYCGRLRLAHTTLINPMFLVGGHPRTQSTVYAVVFLAWLIHKIVEAAS